MKKAITFYAAWIFLFAIGCGPAQLENNERFVEEQPGPVESIGLFLPSPESIEELLAKTDIVLVGSVGRIAKKGTNPQDYYPAPTFESPYMHFEIKVEQVLVGNLESKETIYLLKAYDEDSAKRAEEDGRMRLGQRKLLFLTQHPTENSVFIDPEWISSMDIDKEIVKYYFPGAGWQPPFGVERSPEEMIALTLETAERMERK